MRIPKSWIKPMSKRIADMLLAEQMILDDIDPRTLASEIEVIVTDELMVEDRINDEVRRFLSEHERNMDRGGMDYRKLFELTKQKLVRERGIVI